MAGAHLESGLVVMTAEDRVRINHGPLQVKFCGNDEPDTQAQFVVNVSFAHDVGRVSTYNVGYSGEEGKFQLRALGLSGGAHGEIVSITYSIYQIS